MPALRAIFALFMVPVTAAFGWSRMEYMGPVSVAPLCVALLSAPIGWLIDRRGPRFVLVPGFVLFGIAIACLSFNNGSKPVAALLWAGFGLAAATQTPSAYVKALSGWFSARRGLALGLSLGAGGAVGVALMPPLLGYVISPLRMARPPTWCRGRWRWSWAAGSCWPGFAIRRRCGRPRQIIRVRPGLRCRRWCAPARSG